MPVDNKSNLVYNNSKELYGLLSVPNLKIIRSLDQNDQETNNPAEMMTFEVEIFNDHGSHDDYVMNFTLSLMDDDKSQNSLKVYYIDDPQSHDGGSNLIKFLEQLRMWTVKKGLGFDIKGPNSRYIKRTDTLSESQFSKLAGTVKTSVQMLEGTRIIVKHSEIVNDDIRGARTRKIHRIYVENASGEKFLMPFTSLRGARAMARHVEQGGNPYDTIGSAISEMVAEAVALSRFVRRTRNQQFEDQTAVGMVEAAQGRLQSVKHTLNSLSSTRGYSKNVTALAEENEIEFNEEVKNHFVQNRYDANLDESLPYVWRAYQMNNLREVDEFNEWADGVVNELENKPLADDPKLAPIKKALGMPTAQNPQQPPVDVKMDAKNRPVIAYDPNNPEAKKKIAGMVAGGAKVPAGTTFTTIKEAPAKKEIILTGHGKTVTVPVPDNVGMSHLTDIMARVQKQHPGMEMKYYEDGVQVDETLGGDRADDLITDTMASGQEMSEASNKKPDADKDGIPDWADKHPHAAGGDEDRKEMEESLDRILKLSGVNRTNTTLKEGTDPKRFNSWRDKKSGKTLGSFGAVRDEDAEFYDDHDDPTECGETYLKNRSGKIITRPDGSKVKYSDFKQPKSWGDDSDDSRSGPGGRRV